MTRNQRKHLQRKLMAMRLVGAGQDRHGFEVTDQRVLRLLTGVGFETAGDLARVPEKMFHRIPGFGDRAREVLHGLFGRLRSMGLNIETRAGQYRLGTEVPAPPYGLYSEYLGKMGAIDMQLSDLKREYYARVGGNPHRGHRLVRDHFWWDIYMGGF